MYNIAINLCATTAMSVYPSELPGAGKGVKFRGYATGGGWGGGLLRLQFKWRIRRRYFLSPFKS